VFHAILEEHLYPRMMVEGRGSTAVRSWGAGTAAIVRLLIAAETPLTQVAIAEAIGVTQPRASQVLRALVDADAVSVSARGYRGRRARLLELYAKRSRPHLVEPESFWFSLRPMIDQGRTITRAARARHTAIAVSADLGPDLLVPWRHPTITVVYAARRVDLGAAGFVPAEGRVDASIIVRHTDDPTLLSPSLGWSPSVDGIPIADPVQQWRDLLDLAGEDRREAAGRLRRAILDRALPRS
jgi:hypothetical protein